MLRDLIRRGLTFNPLNPSHLYVSHTRCYSYLHGQICMQNLCGDEGGSGWCALWCAVGGEVDLRISP